MIPTVFFCKIEIMFGTMNLWIRRDLRGASHAIYPRPTRIVRRQRPRVPYNIKPGPVSGPRSECVASILYLVLDDFGGGEKKRIQSIKGTEK